MAGKRAAGVLSLAALIAIFAVLLYEFIILGSVLFIYAAVLVFIIMALNLLSIRSLVLRPREGGSPGRFLEGMEGSRALLLVSRRSIDAAAERGDFQGNDWSMSWINTLEQELGGFLVRDVTEFSGRDLEGKDIVVVSGSAGGLPAGGIRALDGFVKGGGVAIVERPGKGLEGISGVRGLGEGEEAKAITWIDRNVLAEPYNSLMKGMPLRTRVFRAGLKGGCRTLLKIDSRPAVCIKRHGKGFIISLLFDYGLQLVSMQQGVPSGHGYRVRPRSGRIRKATDLIMDEAMLENFIPYADVLEKLLFHIVEDVITLKRPWYFPYQYDGAVLMSHDEEYMGDRVSFVTDYEKGIKATSSNFIIPDSTISEDAIRGMKGFDVGIHWNRQPGVKDVLGIGPLRMVRRVLPLDKQLRLLKGKGADTDVCRIHLAEWGDYTHTFGVMEASGISMDSSYMPNRGEGKGYLFGTGLPFRPLDRNGMPFSLYEVPVLIQDNYGNASLEDVKRLARDSNESYHQCIVLLYHPNRLEKSRELQRDWKGAFGIGGRQWVTSFSELKGWLLKRSKTGAVFVKGGRGLKVSGEHRVVKQLGRDYLLIKKH